MRILLALIIAVPLLAASLEADAGLVEDLRSGKSDVQASSNQGAWIGIIRYWKQQKSAPDFKAIVTARSQFYSWQQAGTAEQAVERAVRYCKEQGGGRTSCQVYAVGDAVVEGYSQKKLADAIEAYQLKVSGSKSTKPRYKLGLALVPQGGNVYCKREDGSIYSAYRSCGQNIETTKSEYDLLKSRRSAYCQKDDASVFVGSQLSLDEPCGPHTRITKWVYERLKDKKTDTASSTEPDAASSGDDPLEAKLEKLQKLLEKGLITEEEAAEKRVKLLEDL